MYNPAIFGFHVCSFSGLCNSIWMLAAWCGLDGFVGLVAKSYRGFWQSFGTSVTLFVMAFSQSLLSFSPLSFCPPVCNKSMMTLQKQGSVGLEFSRSHLRTPEPIFVASTFRRVQCTRDCVISKETAAFLSWVVKDFSWVCISIWEVQRQRHESVMISRFRVGLVSLQVLLIPETAWVAWGCAVIFESWDIHRHWKAWMSEIVGCCLLNLRCLPVGVFWSVCFRLWFRWSYNSTGYFCRVKWRQDLKGWHLPTANMLQHLEFRVTVFGWEDPFIFDDNFLSSLALAMNLTGFLNHAAGVHRITNLNQKICQIEDPYALAGRFVLLGAIRSFWRMTFWTVFSKSSYSEKWWLNIDIWWIFFLTLVLRLELPIHQ